MGQVQGSQREASAAVEARLNLQSSRIDAVDESVQRTEKAAADNAEILHNLLVGIENLSDNVKQLKEEIHGYGDPEVQKELDEVLMKEADETLPVAVDQVPLSVPLSDASVSYPLSSEPVLTPRPSSSNMGNCCALCPGVVDWHNCGIVLGALEFGLGIGLYITFTL